MVKEAEKYLQLMDRQYYKSYGKVVKVVGLTIESVGPKARMGDLCKIYPNEKEEEYVIAEVVGFQDSRLILMPVDSVEGVGTGCIVENTGHPLSVLVGEELLGHTLDGIGRMTDGTEEIHGSYYPLENTPPDPMDRRIIRYDRKLSDHEAPFAGKRSDRPGGIHHHRLLCLWFSQLFHLFPGIPQTFWLFSQRTAQLICLPVTFCALQVC